MMTHNTRRADLNFFDVMGDVFTLQWGGFRQGGLMSRSTGNWKVIEALQNALTDFLDYHKRDAQTDPEWIEASAG
jgi:hypothetical protein